MDLSFNHIDYLLMAFVIALLFMPIGFKIIQNLNIIDKPDSRKVHTQNVLSSGGIVIFFGILSSAIIFKSVDFPVPDCPIKVFHLFNEISKLILLSNSI